MSIGKMMADKSAGSFNLSNFRCRGLIGWIQAIKLRKREFDRFETIRQFYELVSCLSKMKRKNEVTIIFGSFYTPKRRFFKNAQNQRAKLIFSKNAKILLFNVGLFQQVLLTWNDNLAQEVRRLKSKIEFEDWIRR